MRLGVPGRHEGFVVEGEAGPGRGAQLLTGLLMLLLRDHLESVGFEVTMKLQDPGRVGPVEENAFLIASDEEAGVAWLQVKALGDVVGAAPAEVKVAGPLR